MEIAKSRAFHSPLSSINRQKNAASDLRKKDLMTPLPML